MDLQAGLSGRNRAALSSQSRQEERGQALVEFVFVLPLLLMLLIGIIQVGMLMNNWVILTDAVRSGARELSVRRSPPPHPNACTAASDRINAAAIGLTTASIITSTTFSNPSSSTCTNMVAGGDATVTSTYPCNLNILGVAYAPSNCRFTASTTVRIE